LGLGSLWAQAHQGTEVGLRHEAPIVDEPSTSALKGKSDKGLQRLGQPLLTQGGHRRPVSAVMHKAV
jgi:hypothetical protein